MIKATWLPSRNDLVSTTGYALVGFGAKLAPMRAPEYGLDLFAAVPRSGAIWRAAQTNDKADEALQTVQTQVSL